MAVKGQIPPVRLSAYTGATAVTPGAGALADGPTKALYIGTAGSLTVTMVDGVSCVFGNVGVGVLPICVSHVTAAAASNIVALY